MNSVVEYYKQLAQQHFSNDPWLLQIQKQALVDLENWHFPSKQDEDWKYSPLQTFLEQKFCITPFHELVVESEVQGIKIPIINGMVADLVDIKAKLPSGVIIEPISQALEKYPDLVKKHLNQILTTVNGLQALNSLMLKQGLFIYIPQKIKFLKPILLTHINTEINSAAFLRHVIVGEEGSCVNVIEDYQATTDTHYMTNVITEIFVAKNAEIKHFKVQREASQAIHLSHVFVKQLVDSYFESHLLNLGGNWARADISVNLTQPHAKCCLTGIYMPINKQFIENTTYVKHAVSNCCSAQDYRGMADNKAQAVFNGKIYVAKDAIATTASQQNKNLLLSNFARIYTKPQLEIFADDVVCTHGATVGQLDAEALFYFAARGIAEAEARRYLLYAFVEENITKVANKDLADWMRSLLEKHMR